MQKQALILHPFAWPARSYEIWICQFISSSVQKFSRNLLFSSFLKLDMVLEADIALCVTELDFFREITIGQK